MSPLLLLCLILCFSNIQSEVNSETGATFHSRSDILHRLRRQATSSGGPNQQGPGSSGTVGGNLDPSSVGGSPDEKPQEETLTSLKCDFGTSEAPDLCKFKIVESASPLGKGLAAWALGSGKLALYQGGPLMDASGGNDTSGGYIFYETSNPFASTPANRTGLYHASHVSTTTDNFQQVTSARVLVGASNNPGPFANPSFISANLTAPGPAGMCLSFQYAIQGLSAEELRIHMMDHKTERSRPIWASSESAGSNWTKGEVLYSATNVHSLVFSAGSGSSMSLSDIQQRKFRGYIAIDEIEINKHDPGGAEGACRGHCNFDGDLCGWLNAENGQDDDFDWSFGRGSDNLFTGPPRDFVSSSNNELTGSFLFTDSGYPRRPGDRAILVSPMFQPTATNEAMCMRFAVHMFGSGIGSLAIKIRYADEGAAPPTSNPTPNGPPNSPGLNQQNGMLRSESSRGQGNDLVVWEMSGDAGNVWHQAQTSVSSSKSAFQVLIEGVTGENHLGNMAIDEISFSSGPCPTSPPVASKNYGDCTFEQSMCYWRNPDAEIHLDDLDWIRSTDEQSIHGPNFDHTLKKRSGFYLKLENTFKEPKSGTRAFLLSPIFQPKAQGNVQCLSFYYYMFMRSISSSGPNLGTIRVYLASNNELVPIWRLTNPISSPNWKHARASLSTAIVDGQPTAPTKLFQIAFEGIWGDAASGAIALDDITVFDGACDIMPSEAKSVPGECTFDTDMCSWSNKTTSMNGQSSEDSNGSPFLQSVNSAAGYAPAKFANPLSKRTGWQLATVDSRPVNLQDHTYKAPIGYTYVDVLDTDSITMTFPLQSAEVTVQSGQQVTQCLSFWFAAFGRQDANQLNVHLTQASAPPPPPEEGAQPSVRPTGSSSSPTSVNQANSGSTGSNQGASSPSGSSSSASSDADSENSMAWKAIDGRLLWSISLKNLTDMNRRKWHYGQVALKADSNFIVRFNGMTSDGGFALDDLSYYDGACETRPAIAKVQNPDESETAPASPPKIPS